MKYRTNHCLKFKLSHIFRNQCTSKIRLRVILKLLIVYFQELFTELKKLIQCLYTDVLKLGTTHTFPGKCKKNKGNRPKITFFVLRNAFNLARDRFLNFIFIQVVEFYRLYKRFLVFFVILTFRPNFSACLMKNGRSLKDAPIFSCCRPTYRQKIQIVESFQIKFV